MATFMRTSLEYNYNNLSCSVMDIGCEARYGQLYLTHLEVNKYVTKNTF